MATITLSVEEWQQLQRKGDAAELRASQLTRELSEAKIASSPLVPMLLEGFLAGYELVKFCIAHAHPDVVKTQPWPYEALLKFAAVLEQIPASGEAAAHNQEAAIDMRHMAGEAAHWNTRRAEQRARAARGEDVAPVPEIAKSTAPEAPSDREIVTAKPFASVE